jgi:hypothetical protein
MAYCQDTRTLVATFWDPMVGFNRCAAPECDWRCVRFEWGQCQTDDEWAKAILPAVLIHGIIGAFTWNPCGGFEG